MIAPRYLLPSFCATTMAVGPSAAPMMAMEAASLISKNMEAAHRVKKMPNCAAAPKIMSLGLDSSGPKSIIAPMPMNSSSGNSSLAMPASNSTLSAPCSVTPLITCVTAPEKGRLTRMAPNPMRQQQGGLHIPGDGQVDQQRADAPHDHLLPLQVEYV